VRRTTALVVTAVAALAALGCSSAPPRGGADACFNVRNVDTFSPLHGRYVYVRLIGGGQYLLTLDAVYVQLPYVTGIGISSEFSRVCSTTGAVLTFRDATGPIRCRIVAVETVPSRDAAVELVRERTPAR